MAFDPDPAPSFVLAAPTTGTRPVIERSGASSDPASRHSSAAALEPELSPTTRLATPGEAPRQAPAPRRRTGRSTASAVAILTLPPDGPEAEVPGRYAVVEEVGRGGMGRVLRARDRDLDRDVAMKVLGDEVADDDVRQFVDEARITGGLEHPGILPVHELGVDEEGRPYFTMKLLQGGRTLRDVIDRLREGDQQERARWSFERRVSLVQQVALALAHAHAQGVVHRDVKPANILVGPTGEVYLCDWGIAVREGHAAGPGAVQGTPAYMSPEQAKGEALDGRSDVFALTTVLFELLTLHHPLGLEQRRPMDQLLMRILRKEPRDAEAFVDPVAGRVPRTLSRVCARGLEKSPDDRFASARELEQALQAWQEGMGPVVCPGTAMQRGLTRWSRWIDRHPLLAPVALVVLFAAAAGGIVTWAVQLVRALA